MNGRGHTPQSAELPVLLPDWDLPVGALVSTRGGGVSAAPWQGLNLGVHVGDDAAAVAENRRLLQVRIGVTPVWLEQVHGSQVVRVGRAQAAGSSPRADGAWTDEPGVACAVLVADCLPVLLACTDGRAVAAAHAGWRGLVGGVLEATLGALCRGAGCAPSEVQAWLGPSIGPTWFEVGADVLQAFGADRADALSARHFSPRPRPDGDPRWLADLAGLASDRLLHAGVGRVSACGLCTCSDASRFFSYRRDGVTGRLVAAIWRLKA